jgi:hypothetical protein
MKLWLANKLYYWLGGWWCDHTRAPGDKLELCCGQPDDDGELLHVVSTSDDGSTLWIGYRTEWLFHCRAEEARRIAWFILWTWWIKGTWCGLKTAIWYWALKTRIKSSKPVPQQRKI